MSANTDLDDHWTQQYSTPATPSEPSVDIETIEGVEPLDAQFGVADTKTVPDALYVPLFGQAEPTSDELEQVGGNPAKVPPLHTYAILDAAKVLGLPELLATSGLKHLCLFKGDAYDELKDVAPWVVRLEEGSGFTRNLFTRSDAHWHLWDKGSGIYLRSRGTIDDMRDHFRKFTKIKDEQGKWFYFRFWEQSPAIAYFDAIASDQEKWRRWFFPFKGGIIDEILVPDTSAGELRVFEAGPFWEGSRAPRGKFEISDREMHALMDAKMRDDLDEMEQLLRESFPKVTNEMSGEDLGKSLRRTVSRVGSFGIRQRTHVFRIAAWDLHSNGRFESSDSSGQLRQILELQTGEIDKMRRLTERLNVLT